MENIWLNFGVLEDTYPTSEKIVGGPKIVAIGRNQLSIP